MGSVTELVTSTGTVASQYTYDPYGNQSTVSGTVISDIGYAGYFYHALSNLDFAWFRSYDPAHARWLNRDPIEEKGDINLYAYVHNSPIGRADLLGLDENLNGEQACKLVDKGYNPKNDFCGCQKDVVNNLCDCWRKYGSVFQVGLLAACTEKAYFTKSNCIQDCTLNSCLAPPPTRLFGG